MNDLISEKKQVLPVNKSEIHEELANFFDLLAKFDHQDKQKEKAVKDLALETGKFKEKTKSTVTNNSSGIPAIRTTR